MDTQQTPQTTAHSKNVTAAAEAQDKAVSSKSTQMQDSSLVKLSDEQYAAQFKQMDKEALATLIAAVVITCVFWGTIFLFHDVKLNVLHMPLWFVLSCIGGYLFSVVVVLVLVKKFMRNLELKVERFAPTTSSTPNKQE